MFDESESKYSLRTESPKTAQLGSKRRVPPERLKTLDVIDAFERSSGIFDKFQDHLFTGILLILGIAVLLIFLVLAGLALLGSAKQIAFLIFFSGTQPLRRRHRGKLVKGTRID